MISIMDKGLSSINMEAFMKESLKAGREMGSVK